jgi:hypothetical protein
MRHLKEFENIKLYTGSTYIIYGNLNDILKIFYDMYRLINDKTLMSEITVVISSIKKNINSYQYPGTKGLYLLYSEYGLAYHVFQSEEDEYVCFLNYGNTLKGELKIVNNEIVLDTLKVDAKKYNI